MSSNGDGGLSIHEAAQRAGVSAATLRRWVKGGLIPQFEGTWSSSAVGHARLVARLRDRGHSLRDIRTATKDGRLAFGYVEALFAKRRTRLLAPPGGGRDRTGAGADHPDRHNAGMEPGACRVAV